MAGGVFLGVVDRDGSIDIPWRGTYLRWKHNYDPGQNLLVTLETGDNTIYAKVIRVEMPTLEQLKDMKDELKADWDRFTSVFQNATMADQVRMLRALDLEQRRR